MQQAYHVNEVRTGQNSESIINNGYKPLRTLKQFSKEEKSAAINKEAENLRTTNTFVSITDEELWGLGGLRVLFLSLFLGFRVLGLELNLVD